MSQEDPVSADPLQADVLCARMVEIRRQRPKNVRLGMSETLAVADLGSYVRRFPWAAVGISAAAGLLLVHAISKAATPARPRPEPRTPTEVPPGKETIAPSKHGGWSAVWSTLVPIGLQVIQMAALRGVQHWVEHQVNLPAARPRAASESPEHTPERATAGGNRNGAPNGQKIRPRVVKKGHHNE